MPKGNKPLYDLTVVKNMIREGSYTVTKRVLGYLGNHGYVVDEVVEDVFESISESDFSKSIQLEKIPGGIADVYRYVNCYGEEWYVKFFIEGGSLRVRVLSLNAEGMLH